jgi:hypothetical protein
MLSVGAFAAIVVVGVARIFKLSEASLKSILHPAAVAALAISFSSSHFLFLFSRRRKMDKFLCAPWMEGKYP